MTDETQATTAPEPAIEQAIERPIDLDAPDAVQQLVEQRQRSENGQFVKAEESKAEPKTEAEPTETQEAEPALERPDSWPQASQERWAKLDRETQEWLLDRESERSSTVQRAQDDAEAQREASETERAKAEQARQQHERAVAEALALIEATTNRDWADIKTPADIAKLAEEDPFRFARWQAHQAQDQILRAQAKQLYDARITEQQSQFTNWADEQDDIFSGTNKDFADPEKAAQIRREVVMPYVADVLGVDPDQIPVLWQNPIIRDAKMQQALYDAARFHAAQKAAKAAAPKLVAAPQRPGPGRADTGSGLTDAAAKGDMERYAAMRAKGHIR